MTHRRVGDAERNLVRADPTAGLMRIAVADDDVLLREGLASLLERSGFTVVGQAGDADTLLELVRAQVPDLAMIDIRMPPTHTAEGLHAAAAIRAELPQVSILLLSAYVDVHPAMELLSAGPGVGYMLKSRVTDVGEFTETVERIARGGVFVDPALVHELVTVRHRDDALTGLSRREQQVLALMAEGRSNTGIARQLWVTEGTIEKHVHSILTKLALPDSDEDHRRVLAVIRFLEAR